MSIGSAVRNVFSKNASLHRVYEKMLWRRDAMRFHKLSDRDFALQQYRKEIGKDLDLDHPKTFDEKLWTLMLHNHDPLLTKCSDKYAVREYVKDCGLEHILNELYGVYDSADQIDFDSIPSPCFVKCNHTSGGNFIFDRTKPFRRASQVRWMNFMLRQNQYYRSREWNYKNIEPKILVEKLIRDKSGKLPLDYRFLCFDGVPKLMFLDLHACNEDGSHSDEDYRNIYDLDFVPIDDLKVTMQKRDPEKYHKPENFDKMVEYAAILSKPFPHCRVDFYNVDGTILFGELTFYHGAGINRVSTPEWDERLGSWIPVEPFLSGEKEC